MRRDATLFVYGTLMRGQPRHAALGATRSIRVARARGLLYNIGHYPGMVPGDGVVLGEYVELAVPDEIWRRLDAIEGSEYCCQQIAVELEKGETRPAWTYLYVAPLRQARLIKNGDWRSEAQHQQ
ncbi:MAG: gamma-glutamylcyclotransferase family protein [Candidatus Xenobia bacterium]